MAAGFPVFFRRLFSDGNRILFGPARACIFPGADLAYRLGIYEIHVQRALAQALKRALFFMIWVPISVFTVYLGPNW
jgi:hypothetical protein